MDKRLEKRHKRQVARAQKKAKVSEPDVRTEDEIKAAREASRPDSARGNKQQPVVASQSFRKLATGTGSSAKTAG
jgi:hypothetical protein